jgi:hypothetical protein
MAPIRLKLGTIAEVIHYIHLTKFQTDPTIIGETPLEKKIPIGLTWGWANF